MDGLCTAILMGLLSGFGYPAHDIHATCNCANEKPSVKIVAECECRDVTEEEENENVSNESKNL